MTIAKATKKKQKKQQLPCSCGINSKSTIWFALKSCLQGNDHLTVLTCRVPRDDLCLISGLPSPSSSLSIRIKIKQMQKREKREICLECLKRNKLLNWPTCVPRLVGTDHAFRTDVHTLWALEGEQPQNILFCCSNQRRVVYLQQPACVWWTHNGELCMLHQNKRGWPAFSSPTHKEFWDWRSISTLRAAGPEKADQRKHGAFTPHSLRCLMSSLQSGAFLDSYAQDQVATRARSQSR